ncbi:MAG: hypothetical protein HY788_00285 [Deltaproteobacteria bacterium]|nr:hypothetical protein [Deltaproteobacteria bacterium]
MGKKSKKNRKSKKGKPNHQKRPISNQSERRKKVQEKNFSKISIVPKKLIAIICTLSSIIAFVFLFFPRVALEIGPILKPNDPFKNILYLSNNGYFPIYKISCSVYIVEAKGENANFSRNNVWDVKGLNLPKISPDDKAPLRLEHVLNIQPFILDRIKVKLTINCKLWPIPLNFTKVFHIEAKQTFDKKWIWIHSTE